MTGVGNRALFYTVIGHTIAYADRYGEKFALLFIDIDGFKIVNDTLGHDIGDKLLVAIAARIKDCIRESDFIARFGGDEFVVLIKKVTSPSDAENVAAKIILAISNEFDIPPHTAKVGSSIGVSIYPDSSKSPDGLIQKADSEMYNCKKKGKTAIAYTLQAKSGNLKYSTILSLIRSRMVLTWANCSWWFPRTFAGSENGQFSLRCIPGKMGQFSSVSLSQTVIT